jgi:rRNA maturation RNase YbeY
MVLCDDDYIRSLNLQYRGKDYATDVLSFEMPDELDHKIHLPVKLLGDLVISMDTSLRQAQERQHSLLDEARVLLVHGVLHLCGYDHERGQEALDVMARAEQDILSALGWQGSGLISAAGADVHEDLQEPSSSMQQDADTPAPGNDDVAAEPPGSVASDTATRPGGSNSNSSSSSGGGGSSTDTYIYRSSDVELVAIDMDGTLLNGRSQILPSSAKAIRAALDMGVRVVLATGKARPAAIKACELAGLAGEPRRLWQWHGRMLA